MLHVNSAKYIISKNKKSKPVIEIENRGAVLNN